MVKNSNSDFYSQKMNSLMMGLSGQLDCGRRYLWMEARDGLNANLTGVSLALLRNHPHSKNAHMGGMAYDPVTGVSHLFYQYRDGADKKEENMVYRSMEAVASYWSVPCKLPAIKDLDPVTGSGTGRDYEDISAYGGRIAIVFHTKPERCSPSETNCPRRVVAVLRNF